MALIADTQNSSASPTSFLKESVPSNFKYINDPTALTCDSFPVVDFSALTSDDPGQRSKAVDGLAKAFEEWSFFILVNHGVSEDLMNATFSALKDFVSLGEDEKKQFVSKKASDPLQYVGFDMKDSPNQTFTQWRAKLKLEVHPNFHCPHKPQHLRDAVWEYSERSRKVSRKLMEAVSDALQLEHGYTDRVLELDSSFERFVGNYYPPCPRPDQAIGILPHTDFGLFTLVTHNGVSGLQFEHHGQWFKADSPKNSILVNVADQLEKFSNGRYKSLKHRVVVNDARERLSIACIYGTSKSATIVPAPALVEKDGCRDMNHSTTYEEFMQRLPTADDHIDQKK